MSNRAITWAFDCDVTPSAAKFVLVALADFADEANSCYPSQDRLALMTGQSRASVLRHLRNLEEDGFISRVRRTTSEGHRTSDRFTLHVGAKLPMLQFAYLAKTTGLSCNTPTNLSNKVQQDPSYEPPKNPQSINAHFDEFWAVYPRKTGKVKARAAYSRALSLAEPEQILAGAVRYAGDPNRDEAFTKYPATWLAAGCWDDEPLPARRDSSAPRDRQAEVLRREMDAARQADAWRSANPAIGSGHEVSTAALEAVRNA